jgi:hypothetical protein
MSIRDIYRANNTASDLALLAHVITSTGGFFMRGGGSKSDDAMNSTISLNCTSEFIIDYDRFIHLFVQGRFVTICIVTNDTFTSDDGYFWTNVPVAPFAFESNRLSRIGAMLAVILENADDLDGMLDVLHRGAPNTRGVFLGDGDTPFRIWVSCDGSMRDGDARNGIFYAIRMTLDNMPCIGKYLIKTIGDTFGVPVIGENDETRSAFIIDASQATPASVESAFNNDPSAIKQDDNGRQTAYAFTMLEARVSGLTLGEERRRPHVQTVRQPPDDIRSQQLSRETGARRHNLSSDLHGARDSKPGVSKFNEWMQPATQSATQVASIDHRQVSKAAQNTDRPLNSNPDPLIARDQRDEHGVQSGLQQHTRRAPHVETQPEFFVDTPPAAVFDEYTRAEEGRRYDQTGRRSHSNRAPQATTRMSKVADVSDLDAAFDAQYSKQRT